MQKAKVFVFRLAVTVLTLLAYVGAASACANNWYQPETPQCLRNF